MDLSGLIPPSDLLQKARGVEEGLRQRRRLGAVGWFGFLLISAIQVGLEFSKIGLISNLLEKGGAALSASWPLLVLAIVGIFFLLLGTWSKFWLRESRQPFRYICSIAEFQPVGGTIGEGTAPEFLKWLPHDITHLLNERVQRFLFAGEAKATETAKDASAQQGQEPSTVHIHGHCVIRARPAEPSARYEIEVLPRVRIGAPGQPEVMAQSVLYPRRGGAPSGQSDRETYGDLLEEVYHSVVTELYRQLKDDVRRKIDLLPSDRFRLVALLHEANDYARSNTLHAYEEARELYRQAAAISEPDWRTPAKTRVQRWLAHLERVGRELGRWRRRVVSRWRPEVAEFDLLSARALIGYARMALFRRTLAGLTGHTINAAFEARPIAARALARLGTLNLDVPDLGRALFDAQVTLALAHQALDDTVAASDMLRQARASDPLRADEDPVFIFTSALVERHRDTRIGLLRRAVEFAPRFEVAHFQLAIDMEMAWRARGMRDERLADLVLKEYDKLLKINPGNIGGWANSGYICWLLGSRPKLDQARQRFEHGLRLKPITREIFVAELDYGLARLSAELGDFDTAHEHYVASLSAQFAREAELASFRSYFFESMPFEKRPTEQKPSALLERFRRYRANVVTELRKEARAQRQSAGATSAAEQRRTRSVIDAFVLNDLGEAYAAQRQWSRAAKFYRRAIQRDPTYALPYHNLGSIGESNAERLACFKRVVELQPRWPQGRLTLAKYYADAAPSALDEQAKADSARTRIEQIERELAALREERRRKGEEDRRRQRENSAALGLSQEVAPAPARAEGTYGGRTEALEKELKAAETDLNTHGHKVKEKEEEAKAFREDARKLAASLLPHVWLWKDDKLDTDRLRDPSLKSELRWERQLTDLHVEALYAWTRSLASDERERQRAIELLEHIREHLWPASYDLLKLVLRLKLKDASHDAAARKAYAAEVFRTCPVLAIEFSLSELGFDSREQAAILQRGIELSAEEEIGGWLRRQLATRYDQDAATQNNGADAAACYRRAVEADPDDARLQSLLAAKLEQVAGTEGQHLRDPQLAAATKPVLEQALAAANKAAEIEPHSAEYASQASRLRARCANVDRLRQIEERFGGAAPGLYATECPVLVEYSEDLVDLFRPPADSKEAKSHAETLTLLQDGLAYEFGIQFPRVEFRCASETGATNHYRVLLWGTPVVGRELRTDRWLCGAPPALFDGEDIDATDAENPATSNPASWIPAASIEAARDFVGDREIHFWGPFEYVVLHLASILRRYAAEFLRVDDALALMLRQGYSAERCADLREDGSCIELTNVVRALLADQFRVFDWNRTLEAFDEARARHDSLTDVVERMRRHPNLRRQSCYFRWERRSPLVRIGPKFEATVSEGLRAGDGKVLALEPVVTQELLATVRHFVGGLSGDDTTSFLMCSAELRPWIRKLVELEFPFFRVVSEPEVLPDAGRMVRHVLEYEA